ncbi:MAG: prolipoprotein diacylglyceryl transferase, partial [Armatimonadota bacterium]
MHPILFKIGTFEVHTFGVALVISFFVAIALLRLRASRYGIARSDVETLAFWAIGGGILGARALFVAQ